MLDITRNSSKFIVRFMPATINATVALRVMFLIFCCFFAACGINLSHYLHR